MSIAGVLDAMRSDRPLSERLVWQCLENHANGARFWAISIANIASELHLHVGTVCDAIRRLEADGIIRARRGFRQITTYFMLRTYDTAAVREDSEKPKTTPEVDSDRPNLEPDLDSAEPNLNPPSKNPPRKSTSLRSVCAREAENDLPGLFEAAPEVRTPEPAAATVVPAWNAMAAEHGLPTIRAMPDRRKRQLAGRIAEFGVTGMLTAISAVGASAFCCGANQSGWRADFDFLLQPTSLLRVIEGRYANREPTAAGLPGGLKMSAIDQLRRDLDLPSFLNGDIIDEEAVSLSC